MPVKTYIVIQSIGIKFFQLGKDDSVLKYTNVHFSSTIYSLHNTVLQKGPLFFQRQPFYIDMAVWPDAWNFQIFARRQWRKAQEMFNVSIRAEQAWKYERNLRHRHVGLQTSHISFIFLPVHVSFQKHVWESSAEKW